MIAYCWVWENYRLYELPWNSAWTWIFAMFAVDFCYYWVHRCAHGKCMRELFLLYFFANIIVIVLQDKWLQFCETVIHFNTTHFNLLAFLLWKMVAIRRNYIGLWI